MAIHPKSSAPGGTPGETPLDERGAPPLSGAIVERRSTRRRPVVVVVDDEHHLRVVLRLTLAGPGMRVVEARDGCHALHLVRRLKPRVVLLDWMMPGMSGLEVLTAMRSEPAMAETAVVMLTSRASAGDRQRALASGANAYVVKPFSPLELCRLVEELL